MNTKSDNDLGSEPVADRQKAEIYIPGKWIHKAYGSLMLVIIILVFLPGMTAKKELKGFCTALTTGASIPTVRALAITHGYEFTELADDHAVVEDEAFFGPQQCNIRFGASGLVSAAYSLF